MSEEATTEETGADSLFDLGGETEEKEIDTSWKDGIADEYKSNFEKFNDLNGFAKSYTEMQKEFGSRVKVPGDDAGEDAVEDFYKKVGRPETIDGYGYKPSEDIPKEVGWNEDKVNANLKLAHELGMNKRQANKFMRQMEAREVDSFTEAKEKKNVDRKAEMEAALGKIKEEYGGGYKEVLAASNWALNEFADKETQAFIKEHGANNVGLIKMLNGIAKLTMPKEGIEKSGEGTTPSESGLKEAKAIRTDPSHKYYKAYTDPQDPKYREAQDYMKSLYKR